MIPLRLQDKLPLLHKRLLTHGERDLLQILDQFFLYIKEELSLMAIPSTTVTLRPPLKTPTMPLRLPDQLLLLHKRLLTHGERDLLQILDQFFHYINTEQSQMDIHSTTVTLRPPLKTLTIPLRLLDQLLLLLKRLLTHGERDLLQTQDQFSH
jgi:hypothetical protein